ncbi:hypothetical protein EC973_006860 [Apophysomyces ossiformis]|uniref:Metallo-dependent hydrolase n=1 Tax=Apophysomyces ossiformis TaxID=679940 RepID=A0A8H7BN03_9FUNG|nr:hypothetical protein EC973_006860 [Apophysomyces ossiformis]
MCQGNEVPTNVIPTTTEQDFDEELFDSLCDGHCHPHDDIENLGLIPKLRIGHITIMGVRQDDWECVDNIARQCNALRENMCIPSFGLHPWFVHRVMAGKSPESTAEEHYDRVLKASIAQEKLTMIECLPAPATYEHWIADLRERLLEHPLALVGEVGLDRAARLLPGGTMDWHGVKPTTVQTTLEHQLAILDSQIDLAIELDRAVSVHCVQGQGHLLQLLGSKSPRTPVRLCLHSYGASSATIAQFMRLTGFSIYVSFSVAINGRLAPNKLDALIQAVPEDRLLIESDLNSPVGMEEHLVKLVHIISRARQWSVAKTVHQTRKNWLKFVNISQ